MSVFCPKAFETNRLAPGYARFQCFDTLQALCSYLRAVFCNRGLLRALGVGNENASATAAALTFLTRDGAGMFASLALAFYCANSFGRKIKFWRLFADVCNDVALVLDLIAPLYIVDATWFLVCVCLSSCLKSFCGVAAGATRAAITHHFALHADDLADIAAKEGSQETLVTLLGMAVGYFVLHHFSEEGDEGLVWYLFWCLTLVHVWANLEAVRSLHLRTLDWQRLRIILELRNQETAMLTFENVSRQESIFYFERGGFGETTTVWVNDKLPNVGFTCDEKRMAVRMVVEERCVDACEVICAAFAVVDFNGNVKMCAAKVHEFLPLVHELQQLGWDLPASLPILMGDGERVKFKE